MSTARLLHAALSAIAALAALAAARPAAGVELDFDRFPPGPFTSLVEESFTLNWIGYGDHQTVVDAGGGDLALTDADPYNLLGSEVAITRDGGEPFLVTHVTACDLTDDPTVHGSSSFYLRGYYGSTYVGQDYIHYPQSSTPVVWPTPVLAGRPITRLVVHILNGNGAFDLLALCAVNVCLGPATLDHDAQPVGPFTGLDEDGFSIEHTGYDDLQAVVDAGDGDLALKDSNVINGVGAEVVVTRDAGGPFLVGSVTACDFSGDPFTYYPHSTIRLQGYAGSTLVGEADIRPTSASFSEFVPPALSLLAVTELRVKITSINMDVIRDDFGVGDIDLVRDPAVLDHDAHPTGTFASLVEDGYLLEHLLGDYPEVVDLGGGDLALTDANPLNWNGARISITRADGGAFGLSTIWACDLTGDANSEPASRIELTGFLGSEPVGADILSPTSATPQAFRAANLACETLTELWLDIVSLDINGAWFSDDFAVDELVLHGDPVSVLAVPGEPAGSGGLLVRPATPNPFRGAATISYSLDRPTRVRIDVFDVRGRRVARLVDGPMAAGSHDTAWRGRDDAGRPVAAGVYFCRIATDDAVRTRKIVRIE